MDLHGGHDVLTVTQLITVFDVFPNEKDALAEADRVLVGVEAPGIKDSSVRLGNHLGALPFSVLVGADGRVLARRYGAFEDAGQLQDWAAQAR